MKHLYLFLITFFLLSTAQAQIIFFPDVNFENALMNTNCIDIDDDGLGDIDADANDDGYITVSEIAMVTNLYINNQNISNLSGIENFSSLEILKCAFNDIPNADLSALTNLKTLDMALNDLTAIDVNSLANIEILRLDNNDLTSLDISLNPNLINLSVGNNVLTTLNTSNNFNLMELACNGNGIATLDISNNSNLTRLICSGNQLQVLDLMSNPNLEYISCRSNDLTSLDISLNPSITVLDCVNNNISSLNLGTNTSFINLSIGENPLPVIDLSGFLDLETIDIFDLHYPDADFSIFPNLRNLYASGSDFTTLDLSQNQNLSQMFVSNSLLLETINIKNGTALDGISAFNVPSLNYVCIDNISSELWVQNVFANSSVQVNSYCDFDYGGSFFELNGTITFDADNNGCDAQDINTVNLKLQVINDTYTETAITSSSENYTLQLLEGNSTITASLENPNYFIVQPSSVSLQFPQDVSPFSQDFCIVPNGIQNDLEIIITPTSITQAGFNASYRLFYRNKGNTQASGNLSFVFDDNIMDFQSSSLAPTVTAGNLSWTFNNLLPFETRFIDLEFSLNATTDPDFPLSNGDIVNTEAMIMTTPADVLPSDNTFMLDQTIVNSFDPNDKTCLEGETIREAMVGEYLHYLIRFENIGTANAINVVIKDNIDISKFDINSLIPLHASHDFITRIRNTNEVEFIFENINLPFDDANNDGFVVFKIKTLETLMVGDTFSNDAEIFFDFNFPIVTNDFQTTVEDNLSVNEFELGSTIQVYPNPVQDQLYITSEVVLNKTTIYDVNGRVLQHIIFIGNELERTIDVTDLSKGIYFVKLSSENGSTTQKIIKQ
ncbi:T9SS type A sorting domain-containing protein [uncultured Psychroserpens sp.]|uniref:T9SS type A sorting domain-containing protein n=1 Tax=uncultured Psychroserpens sp. TaxID=255436 RepID=UPI002630BBF8|nr:T9SS type A sorting domain-containing protein [uncultured Psychroserpens sp.]